MADFSKDSLTTGRVVLIEPGGNAAWYGNVHVFAGEITKVGRSYFYVQRAGYKQTEYRFEIGSGRYAPGPSGDGNSFYTLYDSLEEYEASRRVKEELKVVRRFFANLSSPRMPDDLTDKIYNLLVEEGLVERIKEDGK